MTILTAVVNLAWVLLLQTKNSHGILNFEAINFIYRAQGSLMSGSGKVGS